MILLYSLLIVFFIPDLIILAQSLIGLVRSSVPFFNIKSVTSTKFIIIILISPFDFIMSIILRIIFFICSNTWITGSTFSKIFSIIFPVFSWIIIICSPISSNNSSNWDKIFFKNSFIFLLIHSNRLSIYLSKSQRNPQNNLRQFSCWYPNLVLYIDSYFGIFYLCFQVLHMLYPTNNRKAFWYIYLK